MDSSMIDAAAEVACRLHVKLGIPREEAVQLAVRALSRVRGAGMGQDEPDPLKKVREAVSPWLWVLSIAGFGMAVINSRRIAKMFSDWKGRTQR